MTRTSDVAPVRFLVAMACACLLLIAAPTWAQADDADEPAAQPSGPVVATAADGPAYPISEFVFRYLHEDHPDHPPLSELMALEVQLVDTPQGYVAPREGVPSVTIRLADVGSEPVAQYHASAIQHILETGRDFFTDRQFMGVFLAPDPADISVTGQDLRPAGQTALRILITTAIVTEMRTIGLGDRFDLTLSLNNPSHARIIERSPIQPYTPEDEQRRDLLHKDVLDEYLFHRSRHPGRRVDAALSASEALGGINLDFRITENRPLVWYFQLANTGTRQTNEWRQRFGLIHNQLTDNDDILTIDYMTTGFDEVNAVYAAYEAPFLDSDNVRWRVFAGYSQYTASEVGSFFNNNYKGETIAAGGEIIANIYQHENFFLDLLGGVRFQHIDVDNQILFVPVGGNESFLLPYVGVRLEQDSEWYSTRGRVSLEFQLGDLTDVDSVGLGRLGRILPDEDWVVLRWDFREAFYLEPLLNRSNWEDPSTPESSTLAHEIYLAFWGQYSFDQRLIAQEQQVVGGMYTVRGYPESLIAGDMALIGTVEYRLHVPRLLGIQSAPDDLFGTPFRFAPQYVYGQPDWDLTLNAFLDVGHVKPAQQKFFETEETLIGAGIGLGLQLKRNVTARVDWGFALRDSAIGNVESGSSRVHFILTLMY